MRSTIGIAFKGDCRNGDDRIFSELIFEIVVLRLAFSQAQPKAVIMNHDSDVVRIVERSRGAIEGGVIEVPLWRSNLPNELSEIMPVFVVAEHAAFGGKVILVPPLIFFFGRQGVPIGRGASDKVTAHGDQSLAALGPESRDNIGGPAAPVEAGDDGLVDFERIHHSNGINGNRGLL